MYYAEKIQWEPDHLFSKKRGEAMTAQQVEILDRSEMTDQLKEMIALDPKETTIVTIDMHRGHLDPEVATMPASDEDCESVISAAGELLGFARSHGIPVVHVKLVFRKNPRSRKRGHEGPLLEGAPRHSGR